MGSNTDVLLVEDNLDDEQLVLRVFSRNNILNQVVVARDGVEALDYLFGTGVHSGRDITQLPAVVFLDLQLPKVNGHEVLRRIRASPWLKALPVVMLTSSSQDEDIVKSYNAGANSYVRKPVEFHEFTETVRQVGTYWLTLNEPLHPLASRGTSSGGQAERAPNDR